MEVSKVADIAEARKRKVDGERKKAEAELLRRILERASKFDW